MNRRQLARQNHSAPQRVEVCCRRHRRSEIGDVEYPSGLDVHLDNKKVQMRTVESDPQLPQYVFARAVR